METDNFTFLPPIVMVVFGMAFLVVHHYGSRPALWWALGFFGHALAFGGELLLIAVSDELRTLIIDGIFIASYFALSQAFAIQFRLKRHVVLHVAACLAAYGLVAYAILIVQSLRLELLLTDMTCALLLLVPIMRLRHIPRKTTDRLLVSIAALTALDIILRSVIFVMVASPDAGFADYMQSGYAVAAQVSATVVGLVFSLTALAAVALDVLNEYRKAAETDDLTGLLNRRGFEIALASTHAGSRAGVIATCDIDHFKMINDEFGHGRGDRVIEIFADIIARHLPDNAHAARFGGEEFVVFLPKCSESEGAEIANVIRREFANRDLSSMGIDRKVTASFGVAATHSSDRSIHDAISRADTRMYLAKAGGRNNVMAEDRISAPPTPLRRINAA